MSPEMVSALSTNGLAIALIVGAFILFRALRRTDNPITIAIIDELVNAAEQALAGEDGGSKFDYVMDLAKKQFPNLDTELIRALIEAAVYRMNQAKQTATIAARQWTLITGKDDKGADRRAKK